jgi:hypothetical protein
MIRFLLRKFFYDLWDNLFKIMLLNLGFLCVIVLALCAVSFSVFYPPLSAALFAVFVSFAFIYLCAAAFVLKEASDYRSFGAGDFFGAFRLACFPGLILGCLFFAGFFLVRFAVPFYLAWGSFAGVALAALCFWTVLVFAAAFQFFPAVFSRLEKHPLKTVKKCFLIFFDNVHFSFFSLFFVTILSLPLILFPAFPLLYLDEGLRLRLLKYGWLEARKPEERAAGGTVPKSGEKSRNIPWKDILAEEMEKTGKRTWKDFVFPWR